MAYINDNLCADYQFGIFRNHRWSFDTVDAIAGLQVSGYFNAANQTYKRGIQIGDEILATQWTTAVPTGGHPAPADAITARALLVVISVSAAGVIDCSNINSRTLTDSD